MKKIIFYGLIALFFASCDNSSSNNEATLKIFLTDAPASYDEVLIDIQEVQIHLGNSSDSTDGWLTLDNLNTGVYNLLDFTNGVDTILAEQTLTAGTISQIRLVLGENNQLNVDGTLYDLEVPSGQNSGLKLNVHANLTEGVTYKMWLDFDAGRSIVKKGNGMYSLKPVIRVFTEATSGSISGVISPAAAMPYIQAVSEASDSLGTYADTANGDFMFVGVPEGVYSLTFIPANGYDIQEIEDVTVTTGEKTLVDTVFFQ